MGEIEEVMDDLKGFLGDKGFMIFIAVAVLFGIYNLFKDSSTSTNTDALTPVTAVASYPDAVTNANVIIDTVQESIDYSEGVILDAIQGMGDEINVNFEATNDYINKGFENMEYTSGLGSSEDLYSSVDKDQIIETITNAQNSLNTQIKNIASSLNGNKSNQLPSAKLNQAVNSAKSYYTYKTKSGLNTSTSIVDALKAIGVNSSMDNRAKIASANGIDNYTGSYQQNVELLEKLKSGKLKKV